MRFLKKKENSASSAEVEPTQESKPKVKLSKEEREKRKRVKVLLSRGGESVPDQFVRTIVDGLKKGVAYSKLSDAEKESYVFDDDFIDHRYGIYDKDGNVTGVHTLGLYLEGIPNIHNTRHEDANALIKAMRDSHLDSLRTSANIYEGTILLVPNIKTLTNLSEFMFIAQAKPVEGQEYPLWLSVADTEVTEKDESPYVSFKDLGPMTLTSYQDFATSADLEYEDILTPEDVARYFVERAEKTDEIHQVDETDTPPMPVEQESTPMSTEPTPDSFDALTSSEPSEDTPALIADADFEGDDDYADMSIERDDEYETEAGEDEEFQAFPGAFDAPEGEETPFVQADESSFEVGAVLEQPGAHDYLNVRRAVAPIEYKDNQSAMLKQGLLELDVVTEGFDQQILSMIPEISMTPFTEEDFKEITGEVAEPSPRFIQQVKLVLESYSAERQSMRQALEVKLRKDFYETLTALGQDILKEFDPEADVEDRGELAQAYLEHLSAITMIEESREGEIPALVEKEKERLVSDYNSDRQRAMDKASQEASEAYDRLNLDAHNHKLENVEFEVRRGWAETAESEREIARDKAQTSIEQIYESAHANLLYQYQDKLGAMIAEWSEHNIKARTTIEEHLRDLVEAEKSLSDQMKQARAESTEVADLKERIDALEKDHEQTVKGISEHYDKERKALEASHAQTVRDLEMEKATMRSEIEAEFTTKTEKMHSDLMLAQSQYKNMAHITQVTSESVQTTFDQNGKTLDTLNETISTQAAEIKQLRENAKIEASEQRRKDGWIWFTIMLIAMVLAFIIGMVAF